MRLEHNCTETGRYHNLFSISVKDEELFCTNIHEHIPQFI